MNLRLRFVSRARRMIEAAALALLLSPVVHAAPCAGFTDVDSAAVGPGFCANVEWLKNRQITLGCTSTTLYCPNDQVTRLQMAAFMNRLGNALTPTALTGNASPGALDLDVSPVVCQTQTFDVTNFPRTAYADASFSGVAASDVTFAADLVYTLNAGGTWVPLNANPNRSSSPAGGFGNAADVGVRDLAVSESIRFGLRISRGGIAGGVDLTDSRCQVRVLVYSRTGTVSPF